MADQPLPEFVVDGEYEDHEWRAAAAKKAPRRSRVETLIYEKGPRRHPYPIDKAHKVPGSDREPARWFPNREAGEKWAAAVRQRGGDPARAPAGHPTPRQADLTNTRQADAARKAALGPEAAKRSDQPPEG